MQFKEDDLRCFMLIWSEEFHEPISAEDARLSAAMLLDVYSMLAASQDTGM
jgi:hypothetical protein